MQIVKNWALIICFASIACTMLELITPDGKMEKMMRLVFGAFMVCAIIVPLFTTFKDININLKTDNYEYNVEKSKKEFDTNINEIAIDKIKDLTLNELSLINVKPRKIDVFMDMRDKERISIKEITVTIDKKNSNKQEEVKKVIKEKLGIKTNVIVV